VGLFFCLSPRRCLTARPHGPVQLITRKIETHQYRKVLMGFFVPESRVDGSLMKLGTPAKLLNLPLNPW
jgi:hypothetical protein